MSFFRYDGSVRTPLGFAVAGCNIAVLTQPCTFPSGLNVAGTPLATIWAASSSNSANITTISWLNGYINFSFDSVPSDVVPGSYISISGVSPTAYNQIWLVAGVQGLVVSVLAPNPGTYISGGSVATSALPNPFQSDDLGNFFFYTTGTFTVQEFDPQYNRIQPLILADQVVVSPGGGTVTSVSLTGDGVVFESSVPGSPVTTSGGFTPTLATNAANLVLCSPASGPAGVWVARQLVAADFAIPAGTVSSVDSTLTLDTLLTGSVTGNPITSTGTLAYSIYFAQQAPNTFLAGPTAGGTGPVTARVIVPADYVAAVVDLPLQTTSIGSTTLFTDAGSGGMYVAYVTAFCSTAGSAGSVEVQIGNIAATNTKNQSTGTANLALLGDQISEVVTFYAAPGSIITYATIVTGATGSPQYDLHIRLVFLG